MSMPPSPATSTLTTNSGVQTQAAFDVFRRQYSPPRLPPDGTIEHADECTPMLESDGLLTWQDGVLGTDRLAQTDPPMILTAEDESNIHLWAVRSSDTVYARERCEFALGLARKVIKHTNLTGGKIAFCSGELYILNETTIYINGKSRRYGPRSLQELNDVALAFKQSGYEVASMGMELDTGIPLPFFGTRASWI